MRLEQGHDSPVRVTRPRCFDRRPDLGRVMRIIVDDQRASEFTSNLESTLHAVELRERFRGNSKRHVELEPNGNRGQRISHVMKPGNPESYLSEELSVPRDLERSVRSLRFNRDCP